MFVTEKQLLSDVLSKKQNIWLKLLHCTSFIPSLDTRVKSVLSGLLLVLVISMEWDLNPERYLTEFEVRQRDSTMATFLPSRPDDFQFEVSSCTFLGQKMEQFLSFGSLEYSK